MPLRKTQLQNQALKYLLQRGVAKLSLRPLAAKLRTSPRMLMFHFKSKEGLLQDVLGELHAQTLASFRRMAFADSNAEPGTLLKRFWLWALSKENCASLRLLYELQVIAAQNPKEYGRYLERMSADWQTTISQFLSQSISGDAMTTLSIAVFDGLFLELMSTGDRTRLTRALDHFISIAARERKHKATNSGRAIKPRRGPSRAV